MIETSQTDSALPSPVAPPGDAHLKRGQLHVFLGMAPGVGKTHAMLLAAQREKLAGRDVVICCLETHGSRELESLVREFPTIPRQQQSTPRHEPSRKGIDLEAVFARRPHSVVVDDLAFSDSTDSRRPKRYQGVVELLDAGIDVYATLNVQQVASRTGMVEKITGVASTETVPDSLLDEAKIELVDLEPERLLKRLREGKVHSPPEFKTAGTDFFRTGNLLALREMAIRLFFEKAIRDANHFMRSRQIPGVWRSEHRLLAAIGPGRTSEQVLRWTQRLADSLNAPWMVLYVEIMRPLGQEEVTQLNENLALARKLGAEVLTTANDDTVAEILRAASQRNVTQIIVEKPPDRPWWKAIHGDLNLRRLLHESGEIEIHAVYTQDGTQGFAPLPQTRFSPPHWRQYFKAVAVVALVTLGAFFFTPLIGAHATALVFLLTVVFLALFLERGPTLLAAAMSAAAWDYFFLPPIFAFQISHVEDAMLLGMYFVVALVLGQLTTRIRRQEEAEGRREGRATALYLLTRELNEAAKLDQLVERAAEQMENVFKSAVAVLLPDDQNQLQLHAASTYNPADSEARVSAWVWQRGQPAGKFTDNMPEAEALYLPLTTSNGSMGVIGLQLKHALPLTIHQRNLLEAFAQQIALALDRQRLNEISEKAQVLAESERLTKTLLDSMSHEVRTPIAAITSATSTLIELKKANAPGLQWEMVEEIKEATGRLNRLVGNFLEAGRLESGAVKPSFNECDVSDLVYTTLADIEKELSRHKVKVDLAPGLPLVGMDFVLMQQALTNLLSNAAFHTPPGTLIEVTARIGDHALTISVADGGAGIPLASLDHIFRKFYRAPNAPDGGTGLGLSLVKGFMEAQGGIVKVENRREGGARFTLHLPLAEKLVSTEETL